MLADAVASSAKQQAEARPSMVVTEQAGSALSAALLPALSQLMEASQAQMQQFQGLPGALQALGEQIGQHVSSAITGSRVIESEKVLDPATGRVVGLRRRFQNGDEDMLPIKNGPTIQ